MLCGKLLAGSLYPGFVQLAEGSTRYTCRGFAIIIINSFIIFLAINNVAYAALVSQWY